MTMSFLPFDSSETISGPETFHIGTRSEPATKSVLLHIPREKLRIPSFRGLVKRPRVAELLKNSVTQFPATFVCGRSGTGKTASVASFAAKNGHAAWNSLEPPDVHWTSFANSTLAAVRGSRSGRKKFGADELISRPDIKDISRFVDILFSPDRKQRELLVFDNVHYVFDTPWFREFFELLLPAIPESTHVIFISRSKPPFPVWRIRSKQFLKIIDEKIFAFDETETAKLFEMNGFPARLAPIAYQNCFGKVAHMLRFAEASADGK